MDNNMPKVLKESKNKITVDFERTSLKERLKLKYLNFSYVAVLLWRFFRFLLIYAAVDGSKFHAVDAAFQRQRTDFAVTRADNINGKLKFIVNIEMFKAGFSFSFGKSRVSGDHGGFNYQELIKVSQFADGLQIIHGNIGKIALDQMAADIGMSFLQYDNGVQMA